VRFVVGITGHRWNKIPVADRVRRALAEVFAEIDAAVRAAAAAPSVRLISCLAEGTDQLAVAARPPGWSLAAELPFRRARYFEDFAPPRATGGIDRRDELTAALAAADTVAEPSDALEPTLAYEQASARMLALSDVLVAVWDGRPAAGRGGTAIVVRDALRSKIPVIWIDPARDAARRVLRGADEEQLTSDLMREIVTTALRKGTSA
jgi:hypothetical protein